MVYQNFPFSITNLNKHITHSFLYDMSNTLVIPKKYVKLAILPFLYFLDFNKYH